MTYTRLDEAIKYYYRTLVIIDLIPHYSFPDWDIYESDNQAELNSGYYIPMWQLKQFWSRVIWEWLSRSETARTKHPDDWEIHNSIQIGYANLSTAEAAPSVAAIPENMGRSAGERANLPQMRHFRPLLYQTVTGSCRDAEELALDLLQLDRERKEILQSPACRNVEFDLDSP